MKEPYEQELVAFSIESLGGIDAIHVHGVRDISNTDDNGTECEVNDDNPQFFSTYVSKEGVGDLCVGDFSKAVDAVVFASELQEQYRVPVHTFFKTEVTTP